MMACVVSAVKKVLRDGLFGFGEAMSEYRVNTYFAKSVSKPDTEATFSTASDAAQHVRRELLRDAKMVTVMVEESPEASS
jgi:hypothetical protein